MENKFEQNAVNLGLNQMFIEEFNKFHNIVDSKIIPKFIEKWKKLTSVIGSNVTEIFQELKKDIILKMESSEEIFPKIVNNLFKVDTFKKYDSNIQIKKEITDIIKKANDEVISFLI